MLYMTRKDVTVFNVMLLMIATVGMVAWLHIPSFYVRGMMGYGNSMSLATFWESIWWIRSAFPEIYMNDYVQSTPFFHVEMDMSVAFLLSLVIGYIGNVAYAIFDANVRDDSPVMFNLAFPSMMGPNIILAPYVLIFYYGLLGIFTVMSLPLIATGIFVVGNDTLGMVVTAYFASMAFVALTVVTSRD